jgi:hypothetical protein
MVSISTPISCASSSCATCDDLLDHLPGQILEILRHHDLEQLRLGRRGLLRQALLEERTRLFGQTLELLDADLIGKQRIPFRRQRRRSGLEFLLQGLAMSVAFKTRQAACSVRLAT